MKNYFLPAALFFLFACGEETIPEVQDVAKPEIILQESTPVFGSGTVCDLPEDRIFTVLAGSKLSLKLEFKDDVALSQYKIDVHNNFDCHRHGRFMTGKSAPWFLVQIKEAAGKSFIVTEELTVPADATAGNYHLLIYATDKVGTEAEIQVYSIQVKDPTDIVAPEFIITDPTTEEITAKKGITIKFAGTVTDNYSLNSGLAELSYKDPDNTTFTVDQVPFGSNVGETTNFSIPFEVPTYAKTGLHVFQLQVYDEKNNSAKKTIKVNIQP